MGCDDPLADGSEDAAFTGCAAGAASASAAFSAAGAEAAGAEAGGELAAAPATSPPSAGAAAAAVAGGSSYRGCLEGRNILLNIFLSFWLLAAAFCLYSFNRARRLPLEGSSRRPALMAASASTKSCSARCACPALYSAFTFPPSRDSTSLAAESASLGLFSFRWQAAELRCAARATSRAAVLCSALKSLSFFVRSIADLYLTRAATHLPALKRALPFSLAAAPAATFSSSDISYDCFGFFSSSNWMV
mmetsp:Transcript_8860/g.26576  ORF Transcript_8860/g.26576 Transcript_8860/m.26576 type:complete len:248 (-) Transcript_8860:1157-1900(-)